MQNEQILQVDIFAQVDKYFDDSSLANGEQPRIVFIIGPPAAGKTTIRKQKFSSGYVLVDAADVFLNLCRDKFYEFPGPFVDFLNVIGPQIVFRAISENRNIVTELIGADFEKTKALIETMRTVGYYPEVIGITCDIEEAHHRNANRSEKNISAFFTQHYQHSWLDQVATEIAKS
jgi:hypothetical protein